MLAVFINQRLWLIFKLYAPYRANTGLVPGQDKPLAPVVADTLAWLREDPEVWTDYEKYICNKNWMDQLEVANDATERVVKNAREVAEISQDPRRRENVVLVMNDHRGRVAKVGKADLNQING